MKNIILRFRDTETVDTISEHDKIIHMEGYSWWGWWRKESEPDRRDLLSDVKSNISDYNFYLFDRSTNRFFVINVTDILFSPSEKISTPDIKTTPNYYESEVFNLWIKIEQFNQISEADFVKVFAIIPSFDFTLFTESDIQAEIDKISESEKRIKLKSDYILHLSDIHFGDDFGFPDKSLPNQRPLLNIILDYVNHELKNRIGLLIISGDITSRGNGDVLLTKGLNFLNALSAGLDIAKDAIVIIPGNHDIPLQNANFLDYQHETTFKLFLNQFYGREGVEPFGLDFFEFPCGKKLDILRINSVKLRKKEESNYGYVDWFLYKNILARQKLDGDIKMAIIHHHLVSMQMEESVDPDYPYANISVTIDSGRVIDGLQKNGFHIVLNGHQHLPGITTISRGSIDNANIIDLSVGGGLTILSAGSAGVKSERFSDELKYNSFSLYLMKTDSLEIEVKAYNPTIEPKRHYFSTLKF